MSENSPVKTDVVREYLEAFRIQGIKAGLYFSILDLTQGIDRRGCSAKNKEYIKGQLTELLTNYGEIPFVIVDGWQSPWGGPSYEELPFEEVNGWVKAFAAKLPFAEYRQPGWSESTLTSCSMKLLPGSKSRTASRDRVQVATS